MAANKEYMVESMNSQEFDEYNYDEKVFDYVYCGQSRFVRDFILVKIGMSRDEFKEATSDKEYVVVSIRK